MDWPRLKGGRRDRLLLAKWLPSTRILHLLLSSIAGLLLSLLWLDFHLHFCFFVVLMRRNSSWRVFPVLLPFGADFPHFYSLCLRRVLYHWPGQLCFPLDSSSSRLSGMIKLIFVTRLPSTPVKKSLRSRSHPSVSPQIYFQVLSQSVRPHHWDGFWGVVRRLFAVAISIFRWRIEALNKVCRTTRLVRSRIVRILLRKTTGSFSQDQPWLHEWKASCSSHPILMLTHVTIIAFSLLPSSCPTFSPVSHQHQPSFPPLNQAWMSKFLIHLDLGRLQIFNSM